MAGEHWFDTLSRALARGISRKDFLRLTGLGALGLIVPAPLGAAIAAMQSCDPPCGATFPERPDCCPGNRCTNLATDRSNCDVCGNACPPGEICFNRRCARPGPPPTQTPCWPSQEFIPDFGCVPRCDPPCAADQVCRARDEFQSVCCSSTQPTAEAEFDAWFTCGETCCHAWQVCCNGTCFFPPEDVSPDSGPWLTCGDTNCCPPEWQCCADECCRPDDVCYPDVLFVGVTLDDRTRHERSPDVIVGSTTQERTHCCAPARVCGDMCCPEGVCDPVDGVCRPAGCYCPEGEVCCAAPDALLQMPADCRPREELHDGVCCGRGERWGTMSGDPEQWTCCIEVLSWCNGVCCALGETCRDGTCSPITSGREERCPEACAPDLLCCANGQCCECCDVVSDQCGHKQFLGVTGPDGHELWTCVQTDPSDCIPVQTHIYFDASLRELTRAAEEELRCTLRFVGCGDIPLLRGTVNYPLGQRCPGFAGDHRVNDFGSRPGPVVCCDDLRRCLADPSCDPLTRWPPPP